MKRTLEELAIFGKPPAFEERLHVGRPNIGDRDAFLARVHDVLDRRWLTNHGPQVRAFEARLADLLGVDHCIAVCNATVGLELLVRACGLSGEVLVPSLTFIATAHILEWQGLTPVFVDVDPQTHNLDPRQVEASISPRTSGILGVHLWGRPCDVDALEAVARHYDLTLLYDAAHAFNNSSRGRMIGNFGRAEVFSFHATKFFNTLEGGAITTNDPELARELRLMKNFGFTGYDQVSTLGMNGKMNEISAAMGLTSLESLEEFVAHNYRNYRQYQQELAAIPGIKLVNYDDNELNNFQYIILEIDPQQTRLGRDQLAEILWSENVLARRYFYPGCHNMEPYRSRYPQAGQKLPVTERLIHQLLALPTGTAVGPAEISQIGEIIRMVVDGAEELRQYTIEHRPRIPRKAVSP